MFVVSCHSPTTYGRRQKKIESGHCSGALRVFRLDMWVGLWWPTCPDARQVAYGKATPTLYVVAPMSAITDWD